MACVVKVSKNNENDVLQKQYLGVPSMKGGKEDQFKAKLGGGESNI